MTDSEIVSDEIKIDPKTRSIVTRTIKVRSSNHTYELYFNPHEGGYNFVSLRRSSNSNMGTFKKYHLDMIEEAKEYVNDNTRVL